MRIKLSIFFILFLFISFASGFLHQSIILYISIILHEFGHVLAAKKSGVEVLEIELMPYGGVVRMEELSKLGGTAEAIVSSAGPAASLALAAISGIFRGFGEVFELAFKYNLFICIFNLLPVIPLDGGKIARNLLNYFMGYRQSTRLLVWAGKAAALMMLIYNIHTLATGNRSAALIAAAVFIYLGAVKEEKLSSYYHMFTVNNTKNILISEGRIKKRFINASEKTQISTIIDRFSPVTLCYVQVLDGEGKTRRILREEEIVAGLLKFGYDGKIEQIINLQ